MRPAVASSGIAARIFRRARLFGTKAESRTVVLQRRPAVATPRLPSLASRRVRDATYLGGLRTRRNSRPTAPNYPARGQGTKPGRHLARVRFSSLHPLGSPLGRRETPRSRSKPRHSAPRATWTVRQALIAGVVDELTLDIAPVLLGSGERIFDGVESLGMEPVEVLHSPLTTHIRYRRMG